MIMADPVEDIPELVEAELSPEEAAAKLSQLKASATKEYSLKNYVSAADLYSEATALQATISGEMAPSNADLLYTYGRCLYHVAIGKSDVLGTKVAGNGGEEPKKKKRKVERDPAGSGEQKTAEEVVETVVEEKNGGASAGGKDAGKPFFQITGDENWTDSEDEAEDAEAGGDEEPDEEDDDFANAYEVLDLARVLLKRRIDVLDTSTSDTAPSDKGKAPAVPRDISGEKRTVMERLADTLDLQAEIWLESERFSDAVPDFEAALELKRQLFPAESSLIAEAHYKLSLALEFASLRKVEQEGEAAEGAPGSSGGVTEPTTEVDESMRKEAAAHMDEAIASCKLRVEKERAAMEATSDPADKEKKAKNIKDVEEMVGEMEQRVRSRYSLPSCRAMLTLLFTVG